MAKTNAERQAKYRNSRGCLGETGDRRINTWVTTDTFFDLAGLARLAGVTQRKMLEQIIAAEKARVTKTMEISSPEWNVFHDVTP